LSEWETKLKAIVSEVKNQDVGSLTGVPSWMMVLLQRILTETGKGSISDVFPNLEVFFTVELVLNLTKNNTEKSLAKTSIIMKFTTLQKVSSEFKIEAKVMKCF
jgi:hypothetical protein